MPREFTNHSVLEVAFVGEHVGQRVLNLLHYRAEGMVDPPRDYTSLDEELMDQLTILGGVRDRFLECLSEDYTLLNIRTQILNPERWSYIDHPQTGQVGVVAQPALPPAVGATLTKKNPGTSRHDRGSLHMGAVPTTFVSEGRLTTTGILAYDNLGDVLIEELTFSQLPAPAGKWQPCILNRADLTISPTFTEVQTQLTSRVNRRRTVGVGE